MKHCEPARPSLSFADAFDLYSLNTDGKQKIAAAIAALVSELKDPVLVDLGAGNGRLAKLLSGTFACIIAVEKDHEFQSSLAAIPTVVPVFCRMQDFVPSEVFDIALMAYSLSGIPKDLLDGFLTHLEEKKKEGGRILVATYENGCAWDRFADPVYRALGIARTGGENRHTAEIEETGRTTVRIQSFDTLIWGENLESLYRNLGFFFFKQHRQYLERSAEFLPLLSSFSIRTESGQVAIPVSEVLLEIRK